MIHDAKAQKLEKLRQLMPGVFSESGILDVQKLAEEIGTDYVCNCNEDDLKAQSNRFWLEESQRAGKIGNYIYHIPEAYWDSSPVLDEILGISHTEKKSYEDWLLTIHPEDKEMMNLYFAELIQNKRTKFDKEYRILKPNGLTNWVWGMGNINYDAHGNPVQMIGTIQDITNRKEAEIRFNQEKADFEKFFNTLNDFIFILDADTKIIHANETVYKRFGLKEDKLIGQTLASIFSQKNLYRTIKSIHELIEGKLDILSEPFITASGEMIHVETRLQKGVWDGKKVYFCVSKDISRLHLSEEKFSKAFHLSPSAYGLSGVESKKYTEVNEAFCKLFGYSEDEVIGKSAIELGIMSPETRKAILQNTDKNGFLKDFETVLYDKSGNVKNVLMSSDIIHIQNLAYRYTIVTDISEIKKAEREVRESEERFRLIAQNTTDVIWTMDINGKYIYVSPSIIHLRGYSAEEVKNQSFTEALSPDSARGAIAIFKDAVDRIQKGEKSISRTVEIELSKKDGSTIWTEIAIDTIFDEEGNFKYFLGVTRDINEKKIATDKLIQSEQRLNTLINASPDFICFKDGAGRWQITNQTGIELFNLHEIDYIGKTDQEITLLSPESYRNTHIGCIESDAQAWENRDVYHVEETIDMPNGVSVVLDVIKVPLFNEDGSRKGLVILGRDMTDRKQAAELIEESREKYRTLSDASFESIFVSERGVCIEQNKTAEKNFGYTEEEAIGRMGTEWIAPEDRAKVMQNMMNGVEEPYEATALRKDGSTFPCILRGKMMQYKGKDVRITSLTDITALKQTEKELRESRERYKLIFQNTPVGIISFDNSGKIITCNDNFVEIIGSSKEALIGLNMINLPDQRVGDSVKKALIGESVIIEGNYQSVTANKGTYIRALFSPVRDGENQVLGGVAIFEDVSERIKAENDLRVSEERLNTLIHASPDFVCFKDEKGRWQVANETAINLFHLNGKNVIGKTDLEISEITLPFFQQAHIECIESDEQAWRNGKALNLEEVVPQPNAESKVFDVIKIPIFEENGDRKALVVIGRDITEKKKSEKALRENEKKLSVIIETSPVAMAINDSSMNITMLNKAFIDTFGYTTDDIPNVEKWWELAYPDPIYRETVKANWMTEMEKYLHSKNKFNDTEVSIVCKDGSTKTVLVTASIIDRENSNDVLIILYDISDRKQSEIRIKESEERLRLIFENAPLGIISFNDKGEIISCNDSLVGIIGSSRSKLIGLDMTKLPDKKMGKCIVDALNGKVGIYEGDYQSVTANKTTPVRATFSPILNAEGNCSGGVGLIEDISERRKSEAQLIESELRYKTLFKTSPTGILVLNEEGIILELNDEILNSTHYKHEELINQSISKLTKNQDIQLIKQHIQQILEGKNLEFDVINYTKEGEECYFHLKETAITLPSGEKGILTVSTDITDRKKAELALKESEEKFRLIAENTSDGIIVFSKDAKIIYASPSYLKILGYSSLEEQSHTADSIYQMIHPDDRDIIFENIYKAISNKEESLSYSFRALHKSGGYIWREDHAKFKYDDDGDYLGSYVICRDITERLKLEHQYELLFNQMMDGLSVHEIICDESGKPIDFRFLNANKAFESQTGLRVVDVIGKTIKEIMPDIEQYWIDIYGEVALSGQSTSFESFNAHLGKHFQVTAFSPAPMQFASLFTDITNRKEAESIIKDHQEKLEELVKIRTNELKVREAYLSAIIDNHPGMFWMKDIDGRFIFSNTANNKFQRLIYGENGYEVIGKTDYDFCPPYQAKVYLKEDKDVLKRKAEIRSEEKVNVNGEDKWFEKLKFPVVDQQGKTIGIAGYSIDITARMKQDALLRMQSEAFESFAISITITDKNGIIEWVNDAFEKLTGYSKKEVIGKTTNLLRSGKTDDAVYKKLWATIMAGLVWEGEFINQRKDGTLYTEESTITPVRDKAGVITHFISLKSNITHRKEMEEALRLSEERWQFAIEGSGDGIYDTDFANDRQYYSTQWKAILGYADHELENKMEEWSSRIHPEDYKKNRQDSLNYIFGKTNQYNNEHRLRCKDGTYKWVLARGIAIHRDENGKATRIIGTISDISDIKQLEETLRKNIEKERELNEMKTRFVATASHEFRTPLASIMITNDSLINYWDRYSAEQIKPKLQKIKSSVTFLTNIVNDVLQLSKIEEGKLDFNPTKADIVSLLKEVVDGFREDQHENPIETTFDTDSLIMSIDNRIMRQAINNLMSNALKYSKTGSPVEVRLWRDENFLQISFRDYGIGIPEEDQKHLFTAFFRASNSKLIQGNGLGLNIIRGSVRAHGGDITFSSKVNEGSTFTISLPIFE